MDADQKCNDDNYLVGNLDVVTTTELNGYDVLLGRGVSTRKSSGNAMFRSMIANHGGEYRSLNKHSQKDEIARRIVLTIRALGGRFLRQIDSLSDREVLNIDSTVEAWVVVDEETGLLKVKQALRDMSFTSKPQDELTSTIKYFDPRTDAPATKQCMPLNFTQLRRHGPLYTSDAGFFNRPIDNIDGFFLRNPKTTKSEMQLVHRKRVYLKLQKAAILTQLHLLQEHQEQRRIDRAVQSCTLTRNRLRRG